MIRRHPELGQSLVHELGGFPAEVERLVMDHHERLDGTGYPRGLGEDCLDLETRIMSVCDVYDALMSQRVYRRCLEPGSGTRAATRAERHGVRPALRRGAGAGAGGRAPQPGAAPVAGAGVRAGSRRLAPAAAEAVRRREHGAQVAGGRGGDRRARSGAPGLAPGGRLDVLDVGARQVRALERRAVLSTTTLIVPVAALEAAGREHERLRAHGQAVALVHRRRRRSG